MTLREIKETLIKMATIPEDGSDVATEWHEQADTLSFLQTNAHDDDVVLYCNLTPCLFLHSLLVPTSAVSLLDVDDLLGWSFNSSQEWVVDYSFPDEGEKGDIWLQSPVEHCGSTTLAKGRQILFHRRFDGRQEDKSYFEVDQQLTQSQQIHFVSERRSYCKFDEAGDIVDVIKSFDMDAHELRYAGDGVVIKKDVLYEHLTLTNSVLVRLFDSARYNPETFQDWGDIEQSEESIPESETHYRKVLSRRIGSFVRGFQIIRSSFTKEDVYKKYRFEMVGKVFAPFLAVDGRDDEIRECSCDPKQLSSYFDPPDHPLQISPVFFKPDVLIKYKNDPEKYTIEPRSINCRGGWHLQTYDINEAGQVHTYLKYLGDLPYSEQLHWKANNVEPIGTISKRAHQNDILGQFDDTYDPLISVKGKVRTLNAEKPAWWSPRADELLERAHYPVTDSSAEWANELMALDQLIVEGLDQKYLRKLAQAKGRSIDSSRGSLKIIQEVLLALDFEETAAKQETAPLFELHGLRSQMKGHSGGQAVSEKRAELIREHGNLKNHFRALATACDETLKLLIDLEESGKLTLET